MLKKTFDKINSEDYSSLQMMNVANSYLSAVRKCNNDPTIEMVGWRHPLIIPIVTNAAFACELFLKALLQKNNELQPGHNLMILFQKLPKEIKEGLIGSQDSKLFFQELSKISCLFQEWRYIYERQLSSLNFSFLISFAEDLSFITNKIV